MIRLIRQIGLITIEQLNHVASNRTMKLLTLLTILTTLLTPQTIWAQETRSPLLVTSHEIRIRHSTRGEGEDIKTFYYNIKEKINIKNSGSNPYTKKLAFVTQLDNDDTDEMTIGAVRGNGEKKDKLEFSVNRKGEIFIEFKEKNITEIKPQETIKLTLDYRVYFLRDDYTKPDVWTKEIRYPHAKESLIIKANPVGSAGYYFYADPFNFHKTTTESGYWESPFLSPTPGTVYKVMTRKGTRPTPETTPAKPDLPEPVNVKGGQASAKDKIKYPKDSGTNKLLLGLIGINIVLVATVVFLVVRNTKSAT